jgi:DNA-binding NtrC family response regulator
MEHAYILASGGPITPEHLPHHVRQRPATLPLKQPENAAAPPPPSPPRTLREVEMEHIFRVLEKHKGNKSAAAAELGIVLKTLYNKLHAWQEERNKQAG